MGDLVFFCALVFMAGANILLSASITAERVPMQWGFDGKPTWYAPKIVGVWGPLVFALAIRTGIYAAQIYIPDKIRGLEFGLAGMGVVFAISHAFLLSRWTKE
jgi:hypothetical protein